MSFFEDTPFIASGRSDVDGLVTIVWTLAIGGAILDIAYHFYRAIVVSGAGGRTSKRRRNVLTWEVGVFLVIAVVALGVVNGLRWEHRRLKLASWDSIEQWRLDNPNLWLVGKEPPKNPFVEAGVEFTDRLQHAPDHLPSTGDVKGAVKDVSHYVVEVVRKAPTAKEAAEAVADTGRSIKDTVQNVRLPTYREVKKFFKRSTNNAAEAASKKADEMSEKAEQASKSGWKSAKGAFEGVEANVRTWREQSSEWLYGNVAITNGLAHSFSWTAFGPQRETSMWDFFQTLVDEASHFWWTQQWMAGYLAWAIFVGIESRNSGLPAFALIVFGYSFSLAAAQSLYHALLLLKPPSPRRRQQNWMPHQAVAILPIVFEMFGLAYLPSAYHKLVADKGTLFLSASVFFNVLQAFLVAFPAIIAVVIRNCLPLSWGTRRASSADAKKDLVLFWYIISLTAITLHVISTVQAFREAWSMMPRWSTLFPLPFGMTGPKYGEARVSGFWTLLSKLGSHDWLSAVAWDVLLSTLSLSYWATVRSADVGSMLKCSVWPWLDETIEAVQEGADVLQEKAEPYIGAMHESVQQLGEAAEPYARDLRKRTKAAVKNAQPYLETAQEYMDEGVEQAAYYAKNAATNAAAYLPPDYRRKARDVAKAVGYGDGEEDEVRNDEDDVDVSEWTEVRRGRSASPKKRRGRPAKSQQRSASKSPAPALAKSRTTSRSRQPSVSSTSRRSSRIQKLATTMKTAHKSVRHHKGEDENEDTAPWYQRVRLPSSSIDVSEELAGEFEAAGLTWGLFIVGGLGVVSAGVFGGHETH